MMLFLRAFQLCFSDQQERMTLRFSVFLIESVYDVYCR